MVPQGSILRFWFVHEFDRFWKSPWKSPGPGLGLAGGPQGSQVRSSSPGKQAENRAESEGKGL
jgi:hypothetical protein